MDEDRVNRKVNRMADRSGDTLRRVEVITGAGRRRRWSMEAKLRVVAESLAENAVVSEVARRHGIRPQQLFDWRRQIRAHGPAAMSEAMPAFAPVVVEGAGDGTPVMPAPAAGTCELEVVISDAVIRIRGGEAARMIETVVKALRSRP